MQVSTLRYTGDSVHIAYDDGPCVFTSTLINQLKYGESVLFLVRSYRERCCTLDCAYSEYPHLTLTLYHI